MVISASSFTDPDAADLPGGSEFEIWTLKDGAPKNRVWRAAIEGQALLTQAKIADGGFEGSAAQKGLDAWEDYGVRVRYRDDHGPCSQFSGWSDLMTFRTDDGSTALFDPTVIREIHLDIPKASWDAINAQATPPGCVPFNRDAYTATLRFEGETFEGVGLHIKGGCGSARNLDGKAGFNINIDWDDPNVAGCPAERRLRGQTKLTLNNGVQDKSFIHERLGYQLYQAMKVPTPRAAHVHLFVNDQDWGIYLNVESIGRRFLSRWFSSNSGMLYEGTYWCDIIPGNIKPGIDDSGCLTREFSPSACSPQDPDKDVEDYELIRQLAQQIQALPAGKFYPAVEAFFDFDTFLSQWAVEGLISHWDGYAFSIVNNYRVYHDPKAGKWTILPTGIDQTFDSDLDPWGVSGVLAKRCTEEPACNAAFAERLKQVNMLFQGFDLPGKAKTIYDQITPGMVADPRKEQSNADFTNAYQKTVNYFPARPPRVQKYLQSHGF